MHSLVRVPWFRPSSQVAVSFVWLDVLWLFECRLSIIFNGLVSTRENKNVLIGKKKNPDKNKRVAAHFCESALKESNNFLNIKVTLQKTVNTGARLGKTRRLPLALHFGSKFHNSSLKQQHFFAVMLCMGSTVAWERTWEVHGWPGDGRIKMDDFKVGMNSTLRL